MTKIGTFSVDWYFHEKDEIASMGACLYYRIAMPFRELRNHGYDTVIGVSFGIAPDGSITVCDGQDWHTDCDVVVFERWMGKEGEEIVQRARATGQTIIQEIDDHFWALPQGHPARKITDPRHNPDVNRENYRRMIVASDGIICSSQFLYDYLGEWGPPVQLCRNAIDLTEWQQFTPPDELRVGWLGAAKYRANDFRPLLGVLGPWLAKHDGEFRHIGHTRDIVPVWKQLQLPGHVRRSAIPLQTMWGYAGSWEGLSLVVVPLEACDFNRAKSWLRGLEAGIAGIPFVATRMAEYEALGFGRLASNRAEWLAHWDELLDPEVRRAEGIMNRIAAEALSIDKQWVQWADALESFGVSRPMDPVALAA